MTLSTVFEHTKALIPYVTFGDPSVGDTLRIADTCFESGADILEIGIPFSDPLADGPVIQASHQRALASGENVSMVAALETVSQLKKKWEKSIVLMAATNLVLHVGIEAFFKQAKKAGLDGIIMPDLSIYDADPYRVASRRYGVPIVFLISPLCTPSRLKKIVSAAEGFIYVISSTGTTGTRKAFSHDLSALIRRIKAIRSIPVAVGFGIGSRDHVNAVFRDADGAIVGSYIVDMLHRNPGKAGLNLLSDTLREWKKG
jgi:tryptophan synthase alpha chain